MATDGIGASVRRKEDHRFITGAGSYTDDIDRPGQVYACFVRSPHAHARINGIDKAAATAAPGVLAVLTGDDVKTAGWGGLICGWMIHSRDGSPMKAGPHPILAQDKVRYVGDHVAMVVAETYHQAKDAAERVTVDYDVLPACVVTGNARAAGQPLVHDEIARNTVYEWEIGDQAAVDQALASAAHVTTIDLRNNRLIPNAIEPRAAIAEYERGSEGYTLWTTSQNPHVARLVMAAFIGIAPEHKLRVIAPDVGGGFGSKIFIYAEECACLLAAKILRRPVKWTGDRSESFVSDAHGRDHVTQAQLAMDADGNFTALRVHTTANMGAYLSTFASCVPTYLYATLLAGQYKTPAIYCTVDAVYTNTAPVDAYRGAGRPEATFVIETIVETAARETGRDPAELRRRNFIANDAFPYQTPVALMYDIGDYDASLSKALELSDYASFASRRAASEAKGKLRGIGLSCYIEACGIAPSAVVGSLGCGVGLWESAKVRFATTGVVQVFTGTHSHGQGHETTFAQLIAEKLGVPIANVEVIHGDTEKTPVGMGTYGSRSMAVGGQAIVNAAEKIIAKGKKIAAHLLEAAEADIDFKDGSFTVKGTDRAKSIGEVVFAAYVPHNYPPGPRAGHGGDGVLRPRQLHLSGRRLRLRGRDRPRDRRGPGRTVHRGRRLRQGDQPDDRRGPGPRRPRARHRPGVDRGLRLRRQRPAAVGVLHGLLHAEGGQPAELPGRVDRDAVHPQHAGRQGLRRGGRDRGAAGRDERGHRCARGPDLDAGNSGKGLAGAPGQADAAGGRIGRQKSHVRVRIPSSEDRCRGRLAAPGRFRRQAPGGWPHPDPDPQAAARIALRHHRSWRGRRAQGHSRRGQTG